MSLRRGVLVPLAVTLTVAAAVVGAYFWWDAEQRADARKEREQERKAAEERKAEAEQWVSKLREESKGLMPKAVEGVSLGMTQGEVKKARGELQSSDHSAGDRTKFWLEEELGGTAKALYGFEEGSERLIQVQVMSRLPGVEGLGSHLASMKERYGPPTGLWRCPDTGGVPTLRFTWRKNVTGIADIWLIHPGGVSQTLYFAPSEVIANSLRRSKCRPTSPKDLKKFPPIAKPEQLKKQVGGVKGTAAGGR